MEKQYIQAANAADAMQSGYVGQLFRMMERHIREEAESKADAEADKLREHIRQSPVYAEERLVLMGAMEQYIAQSREALADAYAMRAMRAMVIRLTAKAGDDGRDREAEPGRAMWPGCRVQLRSGGPDMKVISIKGDQILCRWGEESPVDPAQEATFDYATLARIP